MFWSVFHQIILFRIDSYQKYDSVLFNLQEKHFFSFSGKLQKNHIKSIKANYEYHVINIDNMIQMRNKNDP